MSVSEALTTAAFTGTAKIRGKPVFPLTLSSAPTVSTIKLCYDKKISLPQPGAAPNASPAIDLSKGALLWLPQSGINSVFVLAIMTGSQALSLTLRDGTPLSVTITHPFDIPLPWYTTLASGDTVSFLAPEPEVSGNFENARINSGWF